jgi:carbamoyltransferase
MGDLMITLGICNAETASACIFKNGELVAAISEERLTRIKMDDSFPVAAIASVLKSVGIGLADVDQVAYSWSKGFDETLLSQYILRGVELYKQGKEPLDIFIDRIEAELRQDLPRRQQFWDWAKVSLPQHLYGSIITCYHHEAHAYSAALLSSFNRAVVLTADGRGDYESLTCWLYDRQSSQVLKKMFSSTSTDSLGFFYGRITSLLGFTPCRHEGKITGLAAHGNSELALPLMREMIDFSGDEIRAYPGPLFRPFYTNFSEELKARIGEYSKEDIAAAAQKHLEQLLCKTIEKVFQENKLEALPIVLAGGIFANVRVNQSIKELECVTDAFIQPQMGDGGLCIGAAAYAQHTSGLEIKPFKSAYLGTKISESEVWSQREKFTKNNFLKCDDVASDILESLKAGKVVGIVRGAMEFGPRALCHRSILFKSSDPSCNDWLNKRMNRTEFMPFAPVITEELAANSFEGYSNTDESLRFMTSTIKCKPSFASKCAAVTHVDMTARPQVVSSKSDPFLWGLITRWHEETGEYSLINTSFNAHEEPIVCSAEDAINSLNANTVDVVYIEGIKVTVRLLS